MYVHMYISNSIYLAHFVKNLLQPICRFCCRHAAASAAMRFGATTIITVAYLNCQLPAVECGFQHALSMHFGLLKLSCGSNTSTNNNTVVAQQQPHCRHLAGAAAAAATNAAGRNSYRRPSTTLLGRLLHNNYFAAMSGCSLWSLMPLLLLLLLPLPLAIFCEIFTPNTAYYLCYLFVAVLS